MPTEHTYRDPIETDIEADGVMCAICLAPYSGRVYLSPCFHAFCAACIAEWLNVTLLCPLCKARPSKIHWGVDTTLGILNTITVGKETTIRSSSSAPPESSPSAPRGVPFSWRAALKQVALQAVKEQEILARIKHEAMQDQGIDLGSREENAEDTDVIASSPGAGAATDIHAETGSGYGSLRTTARKREYDLEEDEHLKRYRLNSRSRSPSRSRSRSATPIDSSQYMYDFSTQVNDQDMSNNSKSREEENEALPPLPAPTRREIYAKGMEPTPEEEYPLSDRILVTDMALLSPFLQRDLAVLTDSDPGPTDPIVLAHITSLLTNYGGGGGGDSVSRSTSKGNLLNPKRNARWGLIEAEVAQWVTLSPNGHTTQIMVAQLFVQEMRRIVQKRWRIAEWDSHVKYKPSIPLLVPP